MTTYQAEAVPKEQLIDWLGTILQSALLLPLLLLALPVLAILAAIEAGTNLREIDPDEWPL